jgi:Bacterial pre-peptidase C-terminal domain
MKSIRLVRCRGWLALFPLLLIGAIAPPAFAQSGRAEVRTSTYHDVSPPLRELPPGIRIYGILEAEPVRRIPSSRNPTFGPDPLLAPIGDAPIRLAPATLKNFDGIGQGFTGPAGTFTVNSAPPDTNAAVGPNHIVETVNTDLAVFNKAGTPIFGPVPINTLWSGFGGGCQTSNDGDPIVSYDRIADRWIVSQFQVTTQPFQQCIAVSQTADPTGAYSRYAFNYPDGFPDYPKMGVWPDAYYVTYNLFNNAGTSFLGTKVCAFDRAKMLTGAAATQQCFNTSTSFGGLLPGDLDGTRLPPAGAPNPVVGLGTTSTTLASWKFHVDWTTPANTTFTGPTTLTVPAYTEACGGGTCIPQSGGGSLDSLADRVMYRLAYRNFADGHQALVVNHSVMAGTGTGVRWYELRLDAGNNPSLFQAGTYAPDANFRWMGSIAMDQAGNMALGFSTSASTLKPSIRYTGRLAGDAAGTMTQGEGTVITGAGAQGSSLSRWGDYASMSIDPADDCTFWFATEYIPANGTFNWRTRIASFKFPTCGVTAGNDFSIGASPTSLTLAQGNSGPVTINTAVVSGTAESVALSISGVPAGATASFSPTSVTAGSSSTLTINAGTAALGTYTLTVTGTAASATHSTSVTLTISGSPDFSIAISPASRSVVAGSSTTYTVTTGAVNGSTQSIAFSVSGLPAGASGSFSPTSVIAGGSSTLTVTTSAAASATTFTVTGASTTTHSATASITVTAAIPPDFTVAVSPASQTIAQGASGTYTVSTTALNGSTQSIALSISGLPAGITGSFSPASVTAGGSSTLTVAVAATATAATTTFTVTGASGTVQHSANASVTVTTGSGIAVLTDGVPVSGISGATGSQQFWVMDVPAGKDSVVFTIAGGSGDADLYVRRGAQPTTSVFDCRPFIGGNNETCTFNAPAAGQYYVMIRGFSAFSGVTLTGRTTTTASLVSGVPVTNISGASGSQQFWKLAVPAGKTSLVFTISGGTGDADLYVRSGAKPTTATFNCRPFLTGNNETCTFTNPAAGDWYVMIRGFAAFSGVTLKGTYTP